MIDSSKGESFKFIAKNNIIGEWEMKRSKSVGIDGSFFHKMIHYAKNSKDGETRFHTLPAGKKEKCEDEFFDYDENVFDRNYIVPKEFQYHKSNNGECMLYALLLLIHTDDEELALRLLMKSKEKESYAYSWEWLFKEDILVNS